MHNLDYSDLIGKPYRKGGRGPDEFDCYGLVMETRLRAGIHTPSYITPNLGKEVEEILTTEIAKHIKLKQPDPFCLVAFRMGSGYVSHIGMVLENRRKFIHILVNETVVIESLTSPAWVNRISGHYEFSTSKSLQPI